ncbi:hypothetical protein LSM04_007210 [Trypanosoma melophagium]|uniref:uncharacterized protein n=1 Tax=Trypanosoma melophagium TaxID=715481 RepID=UPI00351A6D21|nr:hypothetical protein LSM04_007210 [Trypanosoma melophagium]
MRHGQGTRLTRPLVDNTGCVNWADRQAPRTFQNARGVGADLSGERNFGRGGFSSGQASRVIKLLFRLLPARPSVHPRPSSPHWKGWRVKLGKKEVSDLKSYGVCSAKWFGYSGRNNNLCFLWPDFNLPEALSPYTRKCRKPHWHWVKCQIKLFWWACSGH